MLFRLRSAALLLLGVFAPPVWAGDAVPAVAASAAAGKQANPDAAPVVISAQRVEGRKDVQIEATGDVEMRKGGQAIFAERLLFLQDSKNVQADGSVRLEQDNNVIHSPHMDYNMDSGAGEVAQPKFQLGDSHARGTAERMRLESRQKYTLHNVSYTTCPVDKDDWLLKVRELEIDRASQLGVAHGARVEFKGVPILYTPWMDFGLAGQRKSGFLGPVFGSTVKGGSDLTLPYYWNIAPNYDATIAPRIMTKRGILLNNEFRYMQASYGGEAHLDVLPGDRLANRTRSHMSLIHSQSLGHGLGASLNLNRVSDNEYFRDLSDAVSGTSQTNLLREGQLSYGHGWWNASLRAQSFQTLQDPAAPVVAPYRRLPQISLDAQRTLKKTTIALSGEFVEFRHTRLVSGQRLALYPSVNYPLIARPAFYLTPKLGLHVTHYKMGMNNVASLPDTTRNVPIFSLDSGVIMERPWSLSGQDFVQTLEPRAYYVYIPYVNQDRLPNFDSAQADFSFAQIFTENRFFGSDRIGDANQVTLALTSRLLEPDSGAERLRLAIGQRFSAITPRVNLVTPAAATSNKSDILLAAAGQLTPAWSLDSTFQYNPNQSRSEKFSASARYQPETGKVLNLGYRFTRNSLRQADVSTQWPLSGRWHGVARWNYSFQDKRLLEALGGLEYNQDCWTVRLVAQRFTTAAQQFSTGFFIQLELNNLVAVGSDPLSLLRQSVPGYAKMNEPSASVLPQVTR